MIKNIYNTDVEKNDMLKDKHIIMHVLPIKFNLSLGQGINFAQEQHVFHL